MPKKQKPNSYTCFVEDYMKKMRREHRCLSKTEAFQEASPLWKALSLEEKALYEAKAKETKLIEKKVDRRLDSLGNSVSQTLRKEQEMEQARRNMIYDIRGLIQSLGTTEDTFFSQFNGKIPRGVILFLFFCTTAVIIQVLLVPSTKYNRKNIKFAKFSNNGDFIIYCYKNSIIEVFGTQSHTLSREFDMEEFWSDINEAFISPDDTYIYLKGIRKDTNKGQVAVIRISDFKIVFRNYNFDCKWAYPWVNGSIFLVCGKYEKTPATYCIWMRNIDDSDFREVIYETRHIFNFAFCYKIERDHSMFSASAYDYFVGIINSLNSTLEIFSIDVERKKLDFKKSIKMNDTLSDVAQVEHKNLYGMTERKVIEIDISKSEISSLKPVGFYSPVTLKRFITANNKFVVTGTNYSILNCVWNQQTKKFWDFFKYHDIIVHAHLIDTQLYITNSKSEGHIHEFVSKSIHILFIFRKRINELRNLQNHSSLPDKQPTVAKEETLDINGNGIKHNVIPMAEDGSCLFHALSYHIHGNQLKAVEIRSEIVSHVIRNWPSFQVLDPENDGTTEVTEECIINCKIKIDDSNIWKIARLIDVGLWEKLAKSFGIDNNYVSQVKEHICMNTDLSVKISDIIRRWGQEKPKESTVGNLCAILIDLKQRKTAMEVYDILNSYVYI